MNIVNQANALWADLTSREKEVHEFAEGGDSAQETGEKLFVSRRTVEFHRQNIMRKAGVRKYSKVLWLLNFRTR